MMPWCSYDIRICTSAEQELPIEQQKLPRGLSRCLRLLQFCCTIASGIVETASVTSLDEPVSILSLALHTVQPNPSS